MGYYIKCPYFVAEKNRTITCEGCIRCFTSIEKKRKQIALCEEGGAGCPYAKKLDATYRRYEGTEYLADRLNEKYIEEAKSQCTKLMWTIAWLEKKLDKNSNCAKENFETQRKEVHRVSRALKLERAKIKVLEETLYAICFNYDLSRADIEAASANLGEFEYAENEAGFISRKKRTCKI